MGSRANKFFDAVARQSAEGTGHLRHAQYSSRPPPVHPMTSRGAGPNRVRKGHDGQRPAPAGPYGSYGRRGPRAIAPRDAARVNFRAGGALY